MTDDNSKLTVDSINSIKYTDEDGRTWIRTWQDGSIREREVRR